MMSDINKPTIADIASAKNYHAEIRGQAKLSEQQRIIALLRDYLKNRPGLVDDLIRVIEVGNE